MKRQKDNLRNKGITLIALVITIIVLLILAGVSIAMLTGENGVLTKATESKEQTVIAKEKEEISLAYSAAKTGKVDKIAEDVTADELNIELDKLNSTGTASGSGTLTVTFENGHKYTIDQGTGTITGPGTGTGEVPDGEEGTTTPDGVTIPKGFYYVGGTKEEGIVISDAPADENKGTSHEVAQTLVGNQFVWVPVEDDEAFKTYEGYSYDYNMGEKEMGRQFYLENTQEPCLKGYDTEKTEYDEMKKSVLEHNGFYVGRYEAGTTNVNRNEESGIEDEVLSKQGVNVYNWIGWSNSSDITVQTGGAVEKSKGMYTDKEKYKVTSTLIYGVQWDAIMAWIDPLYKTGESDETSFVVRGQYDQYDDGPYGVVVTGSKENVAIKNIYDLGGNALEWTMESYFESNYNATRRVYRADGSSTGEGSPSSRSVHLVSPNRRSNELSFRVALYL